MLSMFPPSTCQPAAAPVSLDIDTVKKIAFLARIHVPEDQLAALAGELDGILHFVEQLAAVNTDAVAPMTSVAAMTLTQRDDVLTDGTPPQKLLANAPFPLDDYFAVPKVVE